MKLRNEHVQLTYIKPELPEPLPDKRNRVRWFLGDQDMDIDLFYDDLLTWRRLVDGNPLMTKAAFAAISRYLNLATPVAASFWAYNQMQHNKSMLDETRRTNATSEDMAAEMLKVHKEQLEIAKAELQQKKQDVSTTLVQQAMSKWNLPWSSSSSKQ